MKLRTIYTYLLACRRSWIIRHNYEKLYKKIGNRNPELLKKASGEDLWMHKWGKVNKHVSPCSYRIFSRFIGNNQNIVPLEVFADVIEPILCPPNQYAYYNDKNVFDKLFPAGVLPKTLLRNIRGNFYDINYQLVDNPILGDFLSEKIILKPAVGGESGRGVQIFTKSGYQWENRNGEKLTVDYLISNYGSDYIIQEYLQQDDVMSRFNSSSVNTIRVMTYRSVTTGEISVPNAILRIGASGAEVDNAHQGGMFCGISGNGELGKYVCNFLGEKNTLFNGVDFANSCNVIPNYGEVIDFAKKIARQVIHHHLLALDIMLDKRGNPRLIEINVGGFGAWVFQFTTGPVFSDYTNEVITYCMKNKR